MGLSPTERDRFLAEGYTVVRGVVPLGVRRDMLAVLDGWIEESRRHDRNYGETPNGKARFDFEAGHSAAAPRLRRVANPCDISETYRRFAWESSLPELATAIIGPDIKFFNARIYLKLPGGDARVDYHQDQPYQPHTHDGLVTAMAFLDAMDEENGCLKVVPGSHEERYSHFQDGRFTGLTPPELTAELDRRAVPVTGAAGDVCLLHPWTVHGSDANRSDRPRRLLIIDYVAADAFRLTPMNTPSVHTDAIVRGKPSRHARLEAALVEMPATVDGDSFFVNILGQGAAGRLPQGKRR